MFGFVFLFHKQLFDTSKKESLKEKEMVAMQYDCTPQRVKLEQESSTIDLTQKDSISYQSSAVTVVQPMSTVFPANNIQRLSTPRGMDFKVVLPDGSEVCLNAESTIEFPSSFRSGERRVRLHGEAYFKVTRNEDSPFIVISDQLTVKVLGTEFNLKSYTSEVAHVAL